MLQTRAESGFTNCLYKQITQSPLGLPDTLTDHSLLPWEKSNKTAAQFCAGVTLSHPIQSLGLLLPFIQAWYCCLPCRISQGRLAPRYLQEMGQQLVPLALFRSWNKQFVHGATINLNSEHTGYR